MLKGKFNVVITGPDGVAMAAIIDIEKRDSLVSLALDDGRLQELLVVTSICAGTVEGELLKQQEGGI